MAAGKQKPRRGALGKMSPMAAPSPPHGACTEYVRVLQPEGLSPRREQDQCRLLQRGKDAVKSRHRLKQ